MHVHVQVRAGVRACECACVCGRTRAIVCIDFSAISCVSARKCSGVGMRINVAHAHARSAALPGCLCVRVCRRTFGIHTDSDMADSDNGRTEHE